MKPELRRVLGLLCPLLLLSCATLGPGRPPEDELIPPGTPPSWRQSDWPGVRVLSYEDREEAVAFYALAIDLDSPGLEWLFTPPAPDRGGETLSATVSGFAEETGAAAALNGAPFARYAPLNRRGVPSDISGLYLYEGELISPGRRDYDALYILYDGSVLLDSQARVPPGCRWAVGGFWLALKNGRNLGEKRIRFPRSLIGLSQDGRTLYLAAADGRRRHRAGMTTWETGRWMRWLGAWDALNLDGGGSSALVLREDGAIRVLNSPIHQGIPGWERVVASHIGLRLPPRGGEPKAKDP